MNPIALTKQLVSIPSISGDEARISQKLSQLLKKKGFHVRIIWSKGGRPNCFAYLDDPQILFCSHIDTVPPFLKWREDKKFIYGRGACDAKGVIAAQIASALRLKRQGFRNVGLLFVVGEEVDHRGAIDCAAALGGTLKKMKAVIVGEPTENKLAAAAKGIVKVTLLSRGKAAHSAYPARGSSAIHPLIQTLWKIQNSSWPRHRRMGATTINIGRVEGGVSANVFAERARAQILVRTVTPSGQIYKKMKSLCEPKVSIALESINDPIRLNTVAGFKKTIISFNTDASYLKKLALRSFVLGPGSILDAHGAHERILKKEILSAVSLYEKLVKSVV